MVDTTPGATAESQAVPFRTEVRQLLHILAHSLYSDREIFLRELLSNASDALHRVQFELLTNRETLDAGAELAIRVEVDEESKTLTVSDSGIGMTQEELVEHLGTIARSGVKALMEQLETSQRSQIIGQFGVGFYSVFVVAEEVTVVSRSYRPDAVAAKWQSRGDESFTVGVGEREARGTTVILKLRADAAEFAEPWRLRQIIKKHSDFLDFPIYMGDEQVNQRTALWRQPPHQVAAEAYTKFYHELVFEPGDPLLHVHLSTDAPLDLHAILFVPSTRERGLVERRYEGEIKLYSRKVLIREDAQDLLPAHYRFIEGVVDSEDLPLNVARETVQSSPLLQRIKRTLTGRLNKALAELAESDAAKYATFWREFGPFLKEGIAADPTVRDDLLPLLRFHSLSSGDELIALKTYLDAMPAGQTEIYYVLANDLASARRSPHLEALAARGLDALLLVDMVDSFMLAGLREYEGKRFRNLDDPGLTLPGEADEPEQQVAEEAFTRLAVRVKQVLGDRITEVRGSKVLRESPARLVSRDSGPQHDMERVQRLLHRDFTLQPRILELHRGHPLVFALARRVESSPEDELTPILIEQLYDNALLVEGLHPDPAAMVGRIQTLMREAGRLPAD